MEPLFIFIDLEAAHGNVYFGDIIEIAAKVDPRKLENEVFQTFINTNQNLAHFAIQVCKITKTKLSNQPYFPDAFSSFVKWIDQVRIKCCRKFSKEFYPVLTAHGGFDNDFMMIQSNLERNEMSLSVLTEHNMAFADTYLLAKKLRNQNVESLFGCQLSIEKLFKHYFPHKRFIGQHRALPDVEFMIKIFLESSLVKYFHQIPIASFKERNTDYTSRNTSKIERNTLEENLPGGLAKVTHAMTLQRLLRNGLTHKRLQGLFESSVSYLDFYDKLKDVGIERKAAKAIATRLSSMGLSCRGEMEMDERVLDENFSQAKPILRSDSGYESLDGTIKDDMQYSETVEEIDYFYDQFVDEFFYPPETYEYTFGSFSIEDMKDVDKFIDELFNERYPLLEEGEVEGGGILGESLLEDTQGASCIVNNLHMENSETEPHSNELVNDETQSDNPDHLFLKHIQAMHDLKISQIRQREKERYEGFIKPTSNENWDDEIPDEVEEFHIPTDRGVLAKVVPIGMTINDINGKQYRERVPLFEHFGETDMNLRPDGGIPKLTGRKAKRLKQKMKRKNLAALRLHDVNNATQTLVKSETGEVFVFV